MTMSFATSARHRQRGVSFATTKWPYRVSTLETLCLRSLESSLGKGLATFDLQDLPLGLAEKIYEFVSSKGSRMAHMEILRALAPVLRQHVNSLDFSGAKVSFRMQAGNRTATAGIFSMENAETRTSENHGGRIWRCRR